MNQEQLSKDLKEGRKNFSDETLVGLNFHNAKLSKADFSKASIKKCQFQSADLRQANFTLAECSETTFSQANLEEVVFSRALFSNCNFSCAYLRLATFYLSSFYYCNFSSVNAHRANFVSADIVQCNLDNMWLLQTIGNGEQIKSAQVGPYAFAYTVDTLQVGCLRAPIDIWRTKPPSTSAVHRIEWDRYGKLLLEIIDLCPADT